MSYAKYILFFIVLTVIGVFYDKYKLKMETDDQYEQYDIVKKYLLNDSSLANSKKPIIWIHITYDVNARWWPQFGSRNTKCLNQPYIYLTLRSIVEKCGESFNVCLIDDESFSKIIPGWTTKTENLPAPLRPHLRKLAMAKVLYYYGGMAVPDSFLCFQDLIHTYKQSLNTSMFVGEMVSRSNVATYLDFFPSTKIMGCEKESKVMERYINYLEGLVSHDYTNDMDFNGEPDKWCFKEVLENNITVIDGKELGVKTKNDKPIGIEELLGDEDIDICPHALGVYIPADELLKRTSFGWFVRSSPKQILESNTMVAKYMLGSN